MELSMPADRTYLCRPSCETLLKKPRVLKDSAVRVTRLPGAFFDRASLRFQFAWYCAKHILVRDWHSLLVTLIACSIAGIIATFQYSVYASFLNAGAAAPRAIGAQLWVSAAGVECFDFPDTLNENYSAAIQEFIPGVNVRRIAFGFVPWRSPDGRRNNVALVGVDDLAIPPTSFLADRSDLQRLDLADAAIDQSVRASLSDTTADFAGVRTDLASFLGVPYIFVRFPLARQVLRMDPATVSYLAIDLPRGTQIPDLSAFRERFPELTVRTSKQFEQSSAQYWERKTGAGLAILLAAALATVLLVFLLANGVMRFIQLYQPDFISLVGHGASAAEVGTIVAIVAGTIILAAITLSAVAAPLMTTIFRSLLPWVGFRWTDMLIPLIGGIVAFATSLIWTRRSIAAFGPEAVFRS